MTQAVAKSAVSNTALTGCLAPIDKKGLDELIAKGKADPKVIKTLKCKTVAEGRFRHLNFIRSLPAYVVDEPPGLLGDDTAPNPSEASLAALGSCLAVGIHANAVARGITVFKLEIELEGDLNITGVWGTGDLSDKPVGFTDVRAKVILPHREVVWVILGHFRKAVFSCCCRCGHVGNALALSIMSTAMSAAPPARSAE